MTEHAQTLPEWHRQLAVLAADEDLEWLVSSSPEGHLDAFRRGLSPAEELSELRLMGEWRGCGCGGGG